MIDHLKSRHSDKVEKDVQFFIKMRDSRKTMGGIFGKIDRQNIDGLVASYNISLLIAKSGKPHTMGENLILPAIQEAVTTVMHSDGRSVIKSMPLSNDTVARRINLMASDVEKTLYSILKTTEFSLQIDESTLPDNEALLLAYVRYILEGIMVEEMLFARPLVTDTKGESIYKVVENFFQEKEIPMNNIIACATDGAPAMVGFRYSLRRPSRTLVAKHLSGRLHNSLHIVITVINKIKASAVKERIFRQICHENETEFERLLLHTEVRWLSKGKCLSRFYSLFDTILEFLEEENPQLMQLVSAAKSDVAYLTDIFDKFNAINLQLQGNLVTLVKCKTVVSSFIGKLTLFKQNIARREFYQFPHLAGLQISDDDLLAYCEHLEVLKADMIKRFTDLLELEPPHWLIDPFCVAAPTVPLYLQEELMDLQSDCEEKAHFTMMGYERLWIAIAGRNKFPNLWKVAKLLVLAFPTSYLVERGFSAVVQLLTKQRNRLDISQCGDLRLLLTDMKPDINGIIDEHHAQVHPSH
ncbi:hypothetical protein LOD99_10527 [Oopsacas minuta]|uniref:Uncharacterized protein n=1 Tax=Oopsacas minuta TaxID=111878 RepID=A0AAV7KGV1_9METZ|nr:hypothetical protein LOD99_10527 [Oopsacas minuta]